MSYGPLPARLAAEVGERYTQSGSWGSGCPGGYGERKEHWQQVDWPTFGIDETWNPGKCDKCGLGYDGVQRVWRGSGTHRVYDTPDGELHPGDLYWADWAHTVNDDGTVFCHDGWTNCDGRHLHAVCPNGCHWDIDSRASNCGLPGDTEHRCWIRSGEPPNVNVDKNGRTCSAGAGSIVCSDYHGFLTAGAFSVG